MQEENKEKELYLKEDQDLLDAMESSGPHESWMTQEKMNSIQIKSILRNRKSMIDMDKSTTRYSKVLGIFAIVQIVIGGLQLALEIKGFSDEVFAVFIAVVFMGSLYFLKKILNKNEVINL